MRRKLRSLHGIEASAEPYESKASHKDEEIIGSLSLICSFEGSMDLPGKSNGFSLLYGSVVQLVSTSACHAEGHGFEPRLSRYLRKNSSVTHVMEG